MSEIWRPVVGYEGLYEVSDKCRVRSVDRIVVRRNGVIERRRGKDLKACPIKSGHLVVRLMRVGVGTTKCVHRLVLEAFVGPPPQGHEACHRDGKHLNNSIANLYWGTRSDNLRDQVRHLVHLNARKTHCIHGHEFTLENTHQRNRLGGGRACRTCSRERRRVYRQTLKKVS
jgi:HNH endonuclease/NUMOD4 motif